MMARRFTRVGFVALLALAVSGVPAWGAMLEQPEPLYKAYYLEHETKAYKAARVLYEQIVTGDHPAEVKIAAQAGADRCRDQLAAENFATLMPPDALAYLEIRRPGRIFEQLAGMLGVAGKDMRAVLAQRPSATEAAPFHVPQEFYVSPALFEALNRFGGGAVGITSFDPSGGPPTGVMVVHHGDVAMLKGLLETAFQFAPTAEKIGGLPTFGLELPEVGHVGGVLTESLLIVGTGRDLVESAVSRLLGKESASLASRQDLAAVVEDRGEATLFAYVDIQAALKIARTQMSTGDRREFAKVNALCDLDSLRWATFTAGIDDGTLGLQFTVQLAEGHHSLAYNLLRLPPMTRASLRHVPPDAAAIFGLGLNPAMTHAVADAAGQSEPAVTGFDLGREIFGNLQEICAFVIPGDMIQREGASGPPVIPNIGVVMAVNDPAKSRMLWQQLLSIPGLVSSGAPVTPKTTRISDTDVTTFTIPDFGKVYMAELDHCIVLGATRSAMKAAIRTEGKKQSILDDPVMGQVISELPPDSSLMLVGHVGRLARVAAGSGDRAMAMSAGQAAEMCDHMVGWVGIGQSPNQMTLRAALRGLPDLNVALKKYGGMLQGFARMAMPPQTRRTIVRPAPAAPEEDPEY